jgi:hypothetical protein
MPFNLGDDCFYNYALESSVDSFGPAGAARVTWVSGDNSLYSIVVFPRGCSYVVAHNNISEGTDPGQITATAPPPPAIMDVPPGDTGGGGNRPPLRPPQK